VKERANSYNLDINLFSSQLCANINITIINAYMRLKKNASTHNEFAYPYMHNGVAKIPGHCTGKPPHHTTGIHIPILIILWVSILFSSDLYITPYYILTSYYLYAGWLSQ